jgi:hypothetical protein
MGVKKTKKMNDVLNIGQHMGLRFNEKDNFKDMLENETLVFNGANTQRVVIDTKLDWNDIYAILGDALIKYGEIKKCLEISHVIKPF